MKYFKYTITSILVAVFMVICVSAYQTWEDNVYDGAHVAATDLQNMEYNFNCLKTNFSGTSSPADVEAGQWWFDTDDNILKLRNEGSSAWLEVWDLTNDRPKGLDDPGAIGGETAYAGTFTTLTGDILVLQSHTEGLSGNLTISTDDPQIQLIDPDGADRDIELPAEAENDGRIYIIVNTADGDETLTIKDDGSNVIDTINQSSSQIYTCDGTSWKASSGSDEPINSMPICGDIGAEFSVTSTSWATVGTQIIYIPEVLPAPYLYVRAFTKGATAHYFRYQIDGTTSGETTAASAGFVWTGEIGVDISGITPGQWYDISIQGKNMLSTTTYIGGLAMRYGREP